MNADACEAFALFYKDNRGPVFRALLADTLNRAAAEAATAEAFARALVHWEAVVVHPNPRAWVLRVAWNYHTSSWRAWEARRATEPPAPTASALGLGVDPDVGTATRALPQGQRRVLVLAAFAELTPAEVAEVLGKADGTVRGQLSRARAALRRALGHGSSPEGPGDEMANQPHGADDPAVRRLLGAFAEQEPATELPEVLWRAATYLAALRDATAQANLVAPSAAERVHGAVPGRP